MKKLSSLPPLLKFIGAFLLWYAALVLVPRGLGLDENYDNFFRRIGNNYYGQFREKGIVIFNEGQDPLNINMNTKITFVNLDQNQRAAREGTSVRAAKVFINPWKHGYLPTAFALALILATPLSKKRKWIAMGIGFVLVNAFVIFRQYLIILHTFTDKEWLEVVDYSERTAGFIASLHELFVVNIVIMGIMPVLAWVFAVFSQADPRQLQKEAGL